MEAWRFLGGLDLGLWVVVVRAALGGLYTERMTSVSAREELSVRAMRNDLGGSRWFVTCNTLVWFRLCVCSVFGMR